MKGKGWMPTTLSGLVLLLSIGTQITGPPFQWDEELNHTEPTAGTPPGVTYTRPVACESMDCKLKSGRSALIDTWSKGKSSASRKVLQTATPQR